MWMSGGLFANPKTHAILPRIFSWSAHHDQDCHNGEWNHHAKLAREALREEYDATLYPHMASVPDAQANLV